MFTVMQSVYQNLKLLLSKPPEGRYCVIDAPGSGVFFFVFPIKERNVVCLFVCVLFEGKVKYLFITGTFPLPHWRNALNV